MKNQFFYTRTVTLPPTEEGSEPITRTYRDSFNVDKVIRSVTVESGEVIILLDDMHEQLQMVQSVNPKTNKVFNKEKMVAVQSEITLSVDDGLRFFEITNIGCCTNVITLATNQGFATNTKSHSGSPLDKVVEQTEHPQSIH
jgi:hypothetical protein